MLRLYAVILILLSLAGRSGLLDSIMWLFIRNGLSEYDFYHILEIFLPPIFAIAVGAVTWFAAPLLACLISPQSQPLIANIGGSRNVMWMIAPLFAMWLIITGAEVLIATLVTYSLARNLRPPEENVGYYGDYPALIIRDFFA